MSITGGLGAPKDNPRQGGGRPMDSRLIFRPLCEDLLERQRIQVRADNWISVLGFQICSVGKSTGLASMPISGFEKISGNRGILTKSLSRKSSKIIFAQSVLKTETGGLV